MAWALLDEGDVDVPMQRHLENLEKALIAQPSVPAPAAPTPAPTPTSNSESAPLDL